VEGKPKSFALQPGSWVVLHNLLKRFAQLGRDQYLRSVAVVITWCNDFSAMGAHQKPFSPRVGDPQETVDRPTRYQGERHPWHICQAKKRLRCSGEHPRILWVINQRGQGAIKIQCNQNVLLQNETLQSLLEVIDAVVAVD
jgi:hypothetical protein